VNLLLVFFGAGIGGVLRYAITATTLRLYGPAFPIGTALINISGSFLMGLVAGYFMFKADAASAWRIFLTSGVLGGFTTFSAFSLDVMSLVDRGQWGLAAVYVLVSVLLSIAGLAAGLWLMK
jgi:fluoride exporter